MSRIPGEHILVAFTFHEEATGLERDAAMEILYITFPGLMEAAAGFKEYRFLTDEDDPADYVT